MQMADDLINQTDKGKVLRGTAAEMESGKDWFIKVPNGK